MGAHVSKIITPNDDDDDDDNGSWYGWYFLNLYIEWETKNHKEKKNDWDNDTKEWKKKNTQTPYTSCSHSHKQSPTCKLIFMWMSPGGWKEMDTKPSRDKPSQRYIHNIFRRLFFFDSCGACALIQYELLQCLCLCGIYIFY